MAFYGSVSANLSPILFRGNLFSQGVNIVFHSDISYSMGFSPIGLTNHEQQREPQSSPKIGSGSTMSMFYDGIFPSFLENSLVSKKIGASNDSPNLFTYVDQTLRNKSFTQNLLFNKEIVEFAPQIILATSNYNNYYKFSQLWKNDYIDNNENSYDPTQSTSLDTNSLPRPFQIVSRVASDPVGVNNRYSINLDRETNVPGSFSEDVHGTIWSLYYSGTGVGNLVTQGNVQGSKIGKFLNSFPRKNLPTYVITASNEQENTAPSLLGIAVSTTNNVGYQTSKYTFVEEGFYGRRFAGYFEGAANDSTNYPNTNLGLEVDTIGETFGTQEEFASFFDTVAAPLPLGPTQNVNFPGCNWYEIGNAPEPNQTSITGTTNLGLGEVVLRTSEDSSGSNITNNPNPNDPGGPDSGFKDLVFPKSPNRVSVINGSVNTEKGAFWGPVTNIDRFRSDINNYSVMFVGYFQPLVDGEYEFAIRSAGASFLWIARDESTAANSPINAVSETNVYSNWTAETAHIKCPGSPAERYAIRISGSVGGAPSRRNDNYFESSRSVGGEGIGLPMKGGRFYPFRLIMGNPDVNTTSGYAFPIDGDFDAGTNVNVSAVRLLFDVNPASDARTWSVKGKGRFFGGKAVWEEGSPFFPPKPVKVERTIEQEVLYRDLRIISLSSYNSIDIGGINYDGFFVKGDGSYRHIKLNGNNYSEINGVFDPKNASGGSWSPASIYDPDNVDLQFTISDTQIVDTVNPIRGDANTAGIGAEFKVTKLNDRYLTEVTSGGSNYRIGDRLIINSNLVGGDVADNTQDLVLEVSSLNPKIYTNITPDFVPESGITPAQFRVQKFKKGVFEYTFDIASGGSGYQVDDLVKIPGNQLDGVSGSVGNPLNDLIVKVETVDGSGGITSATVDSSTGTPTGSIFYSTEFLPPDDTILNQAKYRQRPIQIDYETKTYEASQYRNGLSAGIAYTAVSITSIGYSSNTLAGLAYSSYGITSIGYTAINQTNNVGIAYSTVELVGIAYTISDLVGAAYTHAAVQEIEYTQANISGIGYTAGRVTGIAYTTGALSSIGYTATNVTAIGYTAPTITSIGYTAFGINSIVYLDAFGIVSYESISNGGTIIITTSEEVIGTLTDNVCDITIVGLGAGIDGDVTTTIVDTATTFRINGPGGLGNFGPVAVDPNEVKLIIRDSGPGTGNVAIGTAVLATDTEHGFNAGDRLIIRGITDPFYSNWNSTVVAVGASANAGTSLTSFYIDDSLTNTALAGFFTGTSVGSDATVGYETANLELVIPFTEITAGITSIAYDLDPIGNRLPRRFDYLAGTSPDRIRIFIEGSQLNDILNNGDIIYFFDINVGGAGGLNFGDQLNYDVLGYGHTVSSISNDRFEIIAKTDDDIGLGSVDNLDVRFINSGYFIIESDIPIVNATAHGFNDGELIKITGNQNSVYNNGPSGDGGVWQVSNSTEDTFELADPISGITSTAADLITNSGNTLNENGTIVKTTVDYVFEVGIGITVFGVTGESSIYNDGYVISGIKSTTADGIPYAFILEENVTPTELAVPTSSGKIGIHTLSGIATVTSTANFGDPGDAIRLKIQDAPATFFNQVYANAIILDGTRILLGSESERDLNTPNPDEYSDSGNVDGSTLAGLVNSDLIANINFGLYPIEVGEGIDVFDTTSFNSNYIIQSISGNDYTLNSTAGDATDFSLNESGTGGVGVRDIGPVVTISNSIPGITFPNPYFGDLYDDITITIQGSDKTYLNGSQYTAKIVSETATTIDVVLTGSSAFNPIDSADTYTDQTVTNGVSGLIGSNLLIRFEDFTDHPDFTLDTSNNIQVFDTVNFDGSYGLVSVNQVGLTGFLEANVASNVSTDYTILDTTGGFGVRDLGPVIKYTDDYGFNFGGPRLLGDVGDTVSVKIDNTDLAAINGSFSQNVNIIDDFNASTGRIRLTNVISHNPSDYTLVGAGGTIGLIGANLVVDTVDSVTYPVGSSVQIQDISDQFGGDFFPILPANKDTFDVEQIISSNRIVVTNGADAPASAALDFGLVGSAGTLGLIERAVVTTVTPHPFVTGDNIKLQAVEGNGGTFDYDSFPAEHPAGGFTVTVINSTQFILNESLDITFIDNFADANGIGGTALLLGYPATVVSNAHPFETGQDIQIENTTQFDGQYNGITKIDANRFTFGPNATLSTNGLSEFEVESGVDPVYIALRNAGPTVTYNKNHRFVGAIANTARLHVGDQIVIQNSGGTLSNFVSDISGGPGGTVYNVTWASSSIPYEVGIDIADPAIFDGQNEGNVGAVIGLLGSNLRVRSDGHELETSQSIDLQDTNGGSLDGTYTVTEIIDANRFTVNAPTSTSATDYRDDNQVSGTILGYRDYAATATISESSFPIGFEDGSTIDIVSVDDPYTITQSQIKIYGSNTFGVLGDTNPVDYKRTYTDTSNGIAYTGGLRDTPPIITFSSIESNGLNLNLNNSNFNIGSLINLDLINTQQTPSGVHVGKLVQISPTYRLQLVNDSNPSNLIYNPTEVNFRVGLAGSDRVVYSLDHGFTDLDVGVTQLFLNTEGGDQATFGGEYLISEIIDTDIFAIRNDDNSTTALPVNVNSDYTVEDSVGYYVGVGTGARMRVITNPLGNSTVNHALRVGDTVQITDTDTVSSFGTPFDSSFTVTEVINNSTVRLSGLYPSPFTDSNGNRDYKENFTLGGGYFRRTNNTLINGAVRIERKAVEYRINTIVTAGTGYRLNEEFRLQGTIFNGTSGDNTNLQNDLILRITGLNGSTGLLNFSASGTPDIKLDYDPDTFTVIPQTGNGVSASFNIVNSGEFDSDLGFTTYSSVVLNNAGSNYSPNEVLVIKGSLLGGIDGATDGEGNDLLITVNDVGSGGAIIGETITFSGRSPDNGEILNSGITTVYTIGADFRSRPLGIEKTWEWTGSEAKFNLPPIRQGKLSQKHDMLTLADLNKGGLFKIDRVYQYGDIQRKVEIQEIFFYSTSAMGTRNRLFEGSIAYPSNQTNPNLNYFNDPAWVGITSSRIANGEAFFAFDEGNNDDDDQEPTWRLSPGDVIYVLTDIRPNAQVGSGSYDYTNQPTEPYIDYRNVGYGHTILRKFQDNGPGANNDEINDSRGRGFSRGDYDDDGDKKILAAPGFIWGDGHDQISIQTKNLNAPENDSIIAAVDYLIIRETERIRVRSNNHGFNDGDKIYIRYTQTATDPALGTFIDPDPSNNTGLAGTSYIITEASTHGFALNDEGGNPITVSSTMPNGQKLIDTYVNTFKFNTVNFNYWSGNDRNEEFGGATALGDWYPETGVPIVYGEEDIDGNDAPTGTGNGDKCPLTRCLLSIFGEAYTIKPGGQLPVDNRIGLAKAISSFISDQTQV